MLGIIDHEPSHYALLAERALLAALGGNCHSPIAVLTAHHGDELAMQAAIYSPDGAVRVDGSTRFESGDQAAPARLAADLLARAPAIVTDHFSGPA